MNKKGPSMDPWGIPYVMAIWSDWPWLQNYQWSQKDSFPPNKAWTTLYRLSEHGTLVSTSDAIEDQYQSSSCADSHSSPRPRGWSNKHKGGFYATKPSGDIVRTNAQWEWWPMGGFWPL